MAFAGKIAAVSASTKGIGLACVQELLNEGATVYLCSRKGYQVTQVLDRLRETYGEDKVYGQAVHVAKKRDRDAWLKTIHDRHGKLDFLVSNHAVAPYYGAMLDTPEFVWDKVLGTNIKVSALLVQEAVPLLKKSKHGSIVMVNSIAAKRRKPNLGAYSTSKTGMMALVKNFSPELAQHNIRINAVLPGVVKTDFSKILWDNPENKEYFDQYDQKRAGEPYEITNLINFLLSEKASFITGENYNICGGSDAV